MLTTALKFDLWLTFRLKIKKKMIYYFICITLI